MKRFLLTVSFLILTKFAFPVENYPAGARSLALSRASVALTDVWAAFHNQAALASVNHFSAGFYYESRFLVDELSLSAGSVVFPSRTGNFGFSFFQFGKGSYKENKIGLAFSKQLSKQFSAGIQLCYLSQLFPENKRSKGFFTAEAGLLFSASENLVLGAHVFNPTQQGFETFSGKQKVPAVFRFGGSYSFDKSLLLVFETEKDTRNPFVVKSGLEFLPVENLALRFGISGKPFQYTAGIGYSFGKITTDIGFAYHGNLGVTPSVSLQFEF